MYFFLFCFLSKISTIPWQKIWNFFFSLEKMACKNCFKDNQELFIESVTEFQSRRYLVVFLLKIVLNFQQIWLRFCSCKSFRSMFSLFYAAYKEEQHKIYENSLNLDFFRTVSFSCCENFTNIKKKRLSYCLRVS